MNFSKIATLLFALALVGGGSACDGSSDGDGTGGSGGAGGNGGIPGTGGSGGTPGTGGNGTGGDGGGSAGTGGDGGGSAGTGGLGGDGGGSAGTGGVGGDGGGSAGTGGVGGDGGGNPGTGGDGGWPGAGGTGGGMGGSGGGSPSASDCTAFCFGAVTCNWMDPVFIPDCSADCMDWTVDEVECVLSAVATCDVEAGDLCFADESVTWCIETCAEIGACSENPAAAESACFDQCYWDDWAWDPQLSACLDSAAPSCDMSEVNACFTRNDPACTAACNHVYYGCGLRVTDDFGAMDRFECQLYCEWDEWPEAQVQCLTNAACTTTAIDACIP